MVILINHIIRIPIQQPGFSGKSFFQKDSSMKLSGMKDNYWRQEFCNRVFDKNERAGGIKA